jgi:5S rRNA maturation endonuclease (ribonuclease M5)
MSAVSSLRGWGARSDRGEPHAMRAGRDSDEAFEEFVALWEKLRAESEERGAIVVVEGERDRRALRRLGLEGSIALVHRGETLSATAQRLVTAGRPVIVLTDWDGEGGQLARRLKEFLEAERIPFDLDFRRRFARVLRGELAHVEGLYGWARRLAERRGGGLDGSLGVPVAGRTRSTG